ncbi:hypothetical protein V5799_002932 [Amblyomma americanum]|uniref:Ran gtpase-activating protein n=1 Tax=Amblyomma americanum TaxID=6943 RepID=A0AAQ4DAE2_AMBAM
MQDEAPNSGAPDDAWERQLDFERACGADGPQKRCWLSSDLTAWNQVMHGFAFELVEAKPGSLRLQSIPRGKAERDSAAAAREASSLLSWLLGHHRCVEELAVTCAVHTGDISEEAPCSIRLRPLPARDAWRSIRRLEIEERPSAALVLRDVDAVIGVETLKINARAIKPKFAAEIEGLLRRNSSSIKAVDISDMNRLPRSVIKALDCLNNCESLAISSLIDFVRGLPDMNSVAQLVQTSKVLKELSVDPVMDEQISVTAEALKTNPALTKLTLFIPDSTIPPRALFPALEINTTLKELRLTGCCSMDALSGQALASALRKNTCLQELYIEDVDIDASSMKDWPDALSQNTALECFQLSSEQLPISGISALCKLLPANKTLKKLVFAGFQAAQEERLALAEQLRNDGCYGRVQLPWTEADLPGLLSALAAPSVCPGELHLPDICQLSEDGLKLLCDALTPSKRVRTLSAIVLGEPLARGTALCQMLRANRSISCLRLSMADDGAGDFVRYVLHALAVNTAITEIDIHLDKIDRLDTATAFSYMLSRNTTATNISLWFSTTFPRQFVREISRGMTLNKLVVDLKFVTEKLCCDPSSLVVFEALRRNRAALNRAVDFVLRRPADRRCAESFELFAGRSCLLARLVEITGKTEPEVSLDLSAAEHFLQDHYLILTGIIQRTLVCRPAQATQLDALNTDCWRAVVRHLKIGDVRA